MIEKSALVCDVAYVYMYQYINSIWKFTSFIVSNRYQILPSLIWPLNVENCIERLGGFHTCYYATMMSCLKYSKVMEPHNTHYCQCVPKLGNEEDTRQVRQLTIQEDIQRYIMVALYHAQNPPSDFSLTLLRKLWDGNPGHMARWPVMQLGSQWALTVHYSWSHLQPSVVSLTSSPTGHGDQWTWWSHYNSLVPNPQERA